MARANGQPRIKIALAGRLQRILQYFPRTEQCFNDSDKSAHVFRNLDPDDQEIFMDMLDSRPSTSPLAHTPILPFQSSMNMYETMFLDNSETPSTVLSDIWCNTNDDTQAGKGTIDFSDVMQLCSEVRKRS
ncbi:hypothetical protein HRG_000465 [Hirsutella rhossiliensis]|uniref:Uncharacterized protein n=1 Tax=Hirsutella rhossiliensis TaxID=111463 RepID=A0A9P8N3S2_9HYPO|nr:uncharacterized protein HRG_00465 [Hirsutella rhossiliensis]KAH0967823.1 hypothetical protein HRG_00465 [Hirsutella rhossiliensis]